MKSNLKIAVVTSSRADYGLLKPVISRLSKDAAFKLELVVTGTHLSKEFGNTFSEIINDGFIINKRINIIQSNDSSLAITNSCSTAVLEFGKYYSKIKPDAIFILGDRYEIFCAAFAALFFKIPVIHYSGGEKTEGAYDDCIRHSITKMSHVHFVSCNEYKNRVLQLGEEARYVFNVGSLGIDNIKNRKLLSKSNLEKSLHIKLSKSVFVISFYPETLSKLNAKDQFTAVLQALDNFKDHQFIFTKANADNDGRIISKMIDEYTSKNKNCAAFESLGMLRYLSLLKYAKLVIGNSSSGITEVPFFNIPTINIGDRQKGRIQAGSSYNCDIQKNKILATINIALSEKLKRNAFKNNPFGNGNASENIINSIKEIDFKNIVQKKFQDKF